MVRERATAGPKRRGSWLRAVCFCGAVATVAYSATAFAATPTLHERVTGQLPAALQDPSTAVAAGKVFLLGGLTAADTSTDQIVVATPTGAHVGGHLPSPRHDTAAATLSGTVFLFGGGNATQIDEIVRINPHTGATAIVGHLPAPSSDSSATAIGNTAYIVGGYTGTRWLDTIIAWRPGHAAKVVGHLPAALRYAAVTAVGGKVIVAGGSLEDGSASATVLAFDPATARITRIGNLPAPTTHAAAAALGSTAYVIGGRGAVTGTVVSTIIAINISTHRISNAGHLIAATSDLAAATIGNRILIAGGKTSSGTQSTIGVLTPTPARATASARTLATAAPNVYGHDGAGMLTGAARFATPRIYVPNSQGNTVDVIDPKTYKIVGHFAVGQLPQHIVPAWDLKTLYVTNDLGNSLTPINPRTGKPGATIPVDDPYNLYFTPNGKYAIVVAERLHRLDFRDAHTFHLHHSLTVPCSGVDHMDFTADGKVILASCEFSGEMLKIDVATQRVVGTIHLPDFPAGMPQDVKLSPDGRVFYVADMHASGMWEIDAKHFRVLKFLATGYGTHGLYVSRNTRDLYITNRGEGSISVLDFATRKLVAKWRIPGGGSPDMGGVSADGKVLWLSGRYNGVVYAISTRNGKLLAKIPVGSSPHGLCVWPQPGRYSLGHTGILR